MIASLSEFSSPIILSSGRSGSIHSIHVAFHILITYGNASIAKQTLVRLIFFRYDFLRKLVPWLYWFYYYIDFVVFLFCISSAFFLLQQYTCTCTYKFTLAVTFIAFFCRKFSYLRLQKWVLLFAVAGTLIHALVLWWVLCLACVSVCGCNLWISNRLPRVFSCFCFVLVWYKFYRQSVCSVKIHNVWFSLYNLAYQCIVISCFSLFFCFVILLLPYYKLLFSLPSICVYKKYILYSFVFTGFFKSVCTSR